LGVVGFPGLGHTSSSQALLQFQICSHPSSSFSREVFALLLNII
jgi:hypothetical protein